MADRRIRPGAGSPAVHAPVPRSTGMLLLHRPKRGPAVFIFVTWASGSEGIHQWRRWRARDSGPRRRGTSCASRSETASRASLPATRRGEAMSPVAVGPPVSRVGAPQPVQRVLHAGEREVVAGELDDQDDHVYVEEEVEIDVRRVEAGLGSSGYISRARLTSVRRKIGSATCRARRRGSPPRRRGIAARSGRNVTNSLSAAPRGPGPGTGVDRHVPAARSSSRRSEGVGSFDVPDQHKRKERPGEMAAGPSPAREERATSPSTNRSRARGVGDLPQADR